MVENPNGNLNNSGDTITLINSSGTTIDTITYGTAEMPAPKDGESLARTSDGDWLITDATRDTPNVFPVPEAGPSPAPTREDSNETSYEQTNLIPLSAILEPLRNQWQRITTLNLPEPNPFSGLWRSRNP